MFMRLTTVPIRYRLSLIVLIVITGMLALICSSVILRNHTKTVEDNIEYMYAQQLTLNSLNELATQSVNDISGLLYEDRAVHVEEVLAQNEDMVFRFEEFMRNSEKDKSSHDYYFALENEPLILEIRSHVFQCFALFRQGKQKEAREYLKQNIQPLLVHLGTFVNKSTELRKLNMRDKKEWLSERQEVVTRLEVGISVAVISLVILFVLRVGRSITRPISHLAEEIRGIKKQGDLARRVSISGDCEISELETEFNNLITAFSNAKQMLDEEKEWAKVTLDSICDAVISTCPDGHINYLNGKAESLTAWSKTDAMGKSLEVVFNIINDETQVRETDVLACCMSEDKTAVLDNHPVLVSRTGKKYIVDVSKAPIYGKDRELLGSVLVFRDVTDARRLSMEVSYQAAHDSLTGLINRHEFENRLQLELDTLQTGNAVYGLMYMDLDQFKLVNDTCGHIAGDELLRQLGKLLAASVRQRDTLSRLGGDEFGLLMECNSLDDAVQVAEKLTHVVEDFHFVWEDKSFNISMSIGLVLVTKTSGNINELFSAADAACYMAKEQGRNRVHIHQNSDIELCRRHGEMQWAARLPMAIKEDRFKLFYQPIVPLKSCNDESEHYEILLRMVDASGKLVPPGAFLPAAERYNLSVQIDRWVINATFQWLGEDVARIEHLHLCSINLSGLSLCSEDFLAFVIEQFDKTGVPPECICFEITETVAIANLTAASVFINKLKELGCYFALDDFGSGLSSFAYLKNLPVDYLKIDGVFVRDILTDPMDLAMVRSINEMGQIMGKKTIAEFAENDAILAKLQEIGVNYAQGYGVARPRPLEEMSFNNRAIEACSY